VKSDPLWRVSVDTTPEAEEALAAFMEALFGQTPSIYQDVATGRLTATVFLPKAPRRADLKANLAGSGRISITKVRKQDWSESWKRHFKPFTVGRALLIKPSWSRRKPARGQNLMVIDPGLSFGTGQHPTTRFCLEQLAAARRPGFRQSFLDVGTGSGILAIAAAKLGYGPVRALDFDPAAVRVAKENVRKNGVKVAVAKEDITEIAPKSKRYDVVCANLTADLLENCAGKLKQMVKSEGRLVLAGILGTQIDSVRKCFEKRGFSVIAKSSQGEWASLALAQRKRLR
jgi:ribosomal protein L11 methyltransferase